MNDKQFARARAIAVLECMAIDLTGALAESSKTNPMTEVLEQRLEAIDTAQAALREQKHRTYNRHEVACIIAELLGDNCACNFNGIDEWLPMKCELLNACPNTVGVACWEQFLKHREDT